VLVSHSAAIADGLAAMAREVAGGKGRVVPAGGGPDGTLGTDGGRIAAAIGEADSGAGVLVLADIGSAVLSVRAVVEDGDAGGPDVALADAPLVEGAVAGAGGGAMGAGPAGG